MAEGRNSWRIWVVLALAGLVAWQAYDFFREKRGPDNLVNQVWLERWPKDGRDMIGHLVAVEHDGHRVGSAGRASRWRVLSDGFVWGREGDRVRARFPQSGQRVAFQARTWSCAGEAPKQFEICLELTGRQGGKTQTLRFYSRKDWVIRPRDTNVPREIDWMGPVASALVAMPPAATLEEGTDSEDLDLLLRKDPAAAAE